MILYVIRASGLAVLLACGMVTGALALGAWLNSPVLSFISSASGNRDIFMADSRTGQLYNLTQSSRDEWSFTWSGDGRRLLFTSSTVAGSGDLLFTMDVNRRSLQRLDVLPSQLVFNLMWSPDARQIAFFSSYPHNVSDIYVISAAENTIRNLTNTPDRSEKNVAWSPDGTRLLYQSNGDLFTLTLATGMTERITSTAATEDYPTWSPDGTMIAFQRLGASSTESGLFIIDIDKKEVQHIPTGEVAPREEAASWSPDSRELTFTLTSQQVVIYNRITGALTYLTDGTRRSYGAVWSPDGEQIAVIENRIARTYRLADGSTRGLSQGFDVLPPLVWQP